MNARQQAPQNPLLYYALYLSALFVAVISTIGEYTTWGISALGAGLIDIFAEARTRVPSIRYKTDQEKLRSVDTKAILVAAFKQARKDFYREGIIPFGSSKTGVRNGILTPIKTIATHQGSAKAITNAIYNAQSAQKALRIASAALVRDGCMWSKTRGRTHSVNNYFLIDLRWRNAMLYKMVVSNAYHVQFVPNHTHTLYRRDKRQPKLVFTEGFKLKNNSANAPGVRKHVYANPVTWDHGVSFSRKIPPAHYGSRDGYYEVVLPEDHNLLLIDIVKCPRNVRALTPYHRRLVEINSCSDIPAEYVKAYYRDGTRFFTSTQNTRFQHTAIPPDSSVRRGVF